VRQAVVSMDALTAPGILPEKTHCQQPPLPRLVASSFEWMLLKIVSQGIHMIYVYLSPLSFPKYG